MVITTVSKDVSNDRTEHLLCVLPIALLHVPFDEEQIFCEVTAKFPHNYHQVTAKLRQSKIDNR